MDAFGELNVVVGGATTGATTGASACMIDGVGTGTGGATGFSAVVVIVDVSGVNMILGGGTGRVDLTAMTAGGSMAATENRAGFAMGTMACCTTLCRVVGMGGDTLC